MINLLLFALMLVVLVKSSHFAIIYSSRLSKNLHLSEFLTSFLIVSLISVFPETTISIISSFKNVPELGLGTLLGSNVADLTLVFAIIILFSKKGIPVKSQILKKDFIYILLLLLPIILGIDSKYSRFDGIILVSGCLLFFYSLYLTNTIKKVKKKSTHKIKDLLLLI